MKKQICWIFCLLILSVLIFSGTASAAMAGYSHTCHQGVAPTVDGKWTTDTEWSDAEPTFWADSTAGFKDKYVMVSSSPVTVSENLMIESTDTTNDAGDYWSICFDGNPDSSAMTANGGTAPQADDTRLDIVGHGANVTWYKGTGTGWASMAAPASTSASWTESLSASPVSSTPHYCLEITIIKQDLSIPAQFSMRVAINDAHTGGAGLLQWPPSSANVPDDWGDMPYTQDAYTGSILPVPESLSIVAVAVLSSIAVIAGTVLLRRKPNGANLSHSLP